MSIGTADVATELLGEPGNRCPSLTRINDKGELEQCGIIDFTLVRDSNSCPSGYDNLQMAKSFLQQACGPDGHYMTPCGKYGWSSTGITSIQPDNGNNSSIQVVPDIMTGCNGNVIPVSMNKGFPFLPAAVFAFNTDYRDNLISKNYIKKTDKQFRYNSNTGSRDAYIYNKQIPTIDDLYNDLYKNNPNNLTTPLFKEYCDANPTACTSYYDDFCNSENNVNSATCSIWCQKGDNTKCDTTVQKYCAKNKSNTDFCGCINLPTNNAIANTYPHCTLTQCINNNAYKLTSQRDASKCPSIQLCVQDIKLAAGEISTSGKTSISANCSQSSVSGVSTPSTSSSISSTTYIIIIVIIVILCCCSSSIGFISFF